MPERALRFTAAGLGGFIYEATQLLLPDWLRRTRLYDAIVAGLLRIAIELVGGATGILPPENMDAQELLARKAAGTGIELAGLLTIGWSPLWIFALTADVTGGTHTYLRELVSELRQDGLLAEDADIDSVEELLDTLENTSGLAADSLDTPPLNVGDLRQTWQDMQRHATGYPDAGVKTGQTHIFDFYVDSLRIISHEGLVLPQLSCCLESFDKRADAKP